tara:strand:+ start:313 stop:498 length:186 start_codon:yes stop_codon:yes gene_type:complete
MIISFAMAISEMGLGKIEISIIAITSLIFPIFFVLASKNLDSKGVFDWMMEKPEDWIGKKK